MVNVSKQKLNEAVSLRIHSHFSKALLSLRSTKRGEHYLDELLTDSERIVLAKRLAAIVMLHAGYSAYKVSTVLKLSNTTTAQLHERLLQGEFKAIEATLKKKEQREYVWAQIEVLVRGGMPPLGKDRWRGLKKN